MRCIMESGQQLYNISCLLLKVGTIQETFTAGNVQGLGTHEMEDMPDLASEFEEKEDAYDEDDEFDKIEVQSLSLYLLALSLSLSR